MPPGYNRFTVHQKAESYSYDADFVFSDNVAQQSGDLIKHFAGYGEGAPPSRPIPQQGAQSSNVVEVERRPDNVPQLTSPRDFGTSEANIDNSGHISSPDSEQAAVRRVFTEHEGKLTLRISDLKAQIQKDYIIRLVHMVLYARDVLLGESQTSRDEVFEVTDYANLPRTSVGPYISTDTNIVKSSNGVHLSLNLPGREHAQSSLAEVLDPTVPAGKWTPSADTRTPTKQSRAGKKKSRLQTPMENIEVHKETQELKQHIPHEVISDASVLEKTVIALYGLYKAGVEGEVYYAAIADYLYKVFLSKVESESIRSALRRAENDGDKRIVNKESAGYRITPSGIKYIEQKYLANAGSNGDYKQIEMIGS